MRLHFFIWFVLLSVLITFISCQKNGKETTNGELLITGVITYDEPVTLVIEELTPVDVITLDTLAVAQSGEFRISLDIEDAGFYRIRGTNGEFITLAAEPHEKIEISAQAEKLRESYTVKGSRGSELLWQLNEANQKSIRKADSLRSVYRENVYSSDFDSMRQKLKNDYDLLVEQQEKFVISLIDQNPNSLASILVLYQYFEENLLLNSNDHFQYFEQLSKSLCSAYPQNKHVINLKKRVNDIRMERQEKLTIEMALAPGNPCPDIILPQSNGQQIALSSLKGKVVLISFCTVWNNQCRIETEKLIELYNQYNKQGFEILMVSLDQNTSLWANVMEKENFPWKNVNDPGYLNSQVARTYLISQLPGYVLVDRNNRIITRNFTIDDLEPILKENI